MSPTPLKVIAVYECEYAQEIDEYLCGEVFGYRNHHSKWFQLSEYELNPFLIGQLPYPAKKMTEDIKGEVLDYS